MQRLKKTDVHHGAAPRISIGAGNRWHDVYAALEPWNMSATGARNSFTGVVGSILGGGISPFSEHHGWACDTATEFEVVLANSSITTANFKRNQDLFWALKGGGNNFGIVTRVTVDAFRDPPMWHTFQRFGADDVEIETVLQRLQRHTASMPRGVWNIAVTLQWHADARQFVLSEHMVASDVPQLPTSLYRSNSNGSLREYPIHHTEVRQLSTVTMAETMASMSGYGHYDLFGSVTIFNNAQTAVLLAKIFQAEVRNIQDVEGLQVSLVFNPLTRNTMRHMRKHGGNPLRLSDKRRPLTIVNVDLRWRDEHDNEPMQDFMRALIGEFRQVASEAGTLCPYIFQNHAFDEHDVFAGYGEANLKRLRTIRQEVDPDGIFQWLQPGYFKLEKSDKVFGSEPVVVRDEL